MEKSTKQKVFKINDTDKPLTRHRKKETQVKSK